MSRRHGQPVDRAPPPVPAGDDGADDPPVGLGHDERARVAVQQAGERLGRIGGGGIRRDLPQGEHGGDVIGHRRPDVPRGHVRETPGSQSPNAVVAARLPHLGPVADVDRHVAGDAEHVAQGHPRRLEEPLPGLVLHQEDPAEGAQQPDELVGVQGDVPGDHRLLGLIERDARRDLEGLHERGPVVQRRRQLGLALFVDGGCTLAAEERPRLGDHARLRVGPGPDGGQRAAGNEDPTDLEQGGDGVHPVPRGRRQDGVRAGVGERDRLAPARHGPRIGDRLGQHRPHAVVGLHGHHLVGPPDQQPGQGARAGTQVDHRPHVGREDPVHRLDRGPGR